MVINSSSLSCLATSGSTQKRTTRTSSHVSKRQTGDSGSSVAAAAGDQVTLSHKLNGSFRPEEQDCLNDQLVLSMVKNDIAGVQAALRQGASTRMNVQNNPLLHFALKNNCRPEIVVLLLARGAAADINTKDQGFKGLTLLEYSLQEYASNKDDSDARKKAKGISGLLLMYGADPNLLPEGTKQQHAQFFTGALTRAGQYLDLPRSIQQKKEYHKVHELSDKQWTLLQARRSRVLKMVQNILRANIPGLDVEPLRAQCNLALERTNQAVEQIDKSKAGSTAAIAQILGDMEYILDTKLPLDSEQMQAYAQHAVQCIVQQQVLNTFNASAANAEPVTRDGELPERFSSSPFIVDEPSFLKEIEDGQFLEGLGLNEFVDPTLEPA